MQKNLKLTSVRLDPDMLQTIEVFQRNHRYWTRNAIINSILMSVFENFPDRDIYDMVRTNHVTKSPVVAVYRIQTNPEVKNDNQENKDHAENFE